MYLGSLQRILIDEASYHEVELAEAEEDQEDLLDPGDPLHPHYGDSQEHGQGDGAHDPHVVDTAVDKESGEVLNVGPAQVEHGLAEADDIPAEKIDVEKVNEEGVEDETGSYMEMAMEFARVNMRPMAPPNSGPRDLDKKT